MDFIAAASDLRDKAWAELSASTAFIAFRAADNMVVEMGGESAMPRFPERSREPSDGSAFVGAVIGRQVESVTSARTRTRATSKPTQPDTAEVVLKELGPMKMQDVMDFAVEKGATAGGANPLMNFRSALSKDPRFYSFKHKGEFLWWLHDVDLPEGFNEAAGDLLNGAASSDSNQEGGDGDAATMT
jgi:hypothetical protein